MEVPFPPAFAPILEDPRHWKATKLSGGANNQVYKLQREGKEYLLKGYAPAGDGHDRYTAEKDFYGWIQAQGVPQTPHALGWDDEGRLAILTIIPGKPPSSPVSKGQILQSANFVITLNHQRHEAEGFGIGQATDTAFALSGHVANIERRILRLQGIGGDTPQHDQMRAFLGEELFPKWEEAVAKASKSPLYDEVVPTECRILSPSDIGFHNALVAPSGTLYFFDFEYSGWDDPGKTASDFLCQPRYVLPKQFFNLFPEAIAGLFSANGAKLFKERLRLLCPLHCIKWCCIFLNEFLPEHITRRQASLGINPNEPDYLIGQIQKARKHLDTFMTDQPWLT
jgi:hypothetical protein